MKLNRQDVQKLLEQHIGSDCGAYALVTYDNITESIWFANMGKWEGDKNWYLESSNQLYVYNVKSNKDIKYYKGYGCIICDNKAYEIVSYQTAPFLPDEIDSIEFITEEECVDWLIKEDCKKEKLC